MLALGSGVLVKEMIWIGIVESETGKRRKAMQECGVNEK